MAHSTLRRGAFIGFASISALSTLLSFHLSRSGAVQAAPVPQGAAPPACCAGALEDDDPIWNPPSGFSNCFPIMGADHRRYFDAYKVSVYANSTWIFTTCAASNGEPCGLIGQAQGGVHTALYLYRDRFYPEAPCWNLVDMQDNGSPSYCPYYSRMSTYLEPGDYIVVVSSQTSAFENNGQPKASGMGAYNLKGTPTPATAGEYPGVFVCTPATASDLVHETCEDQIDILGRVTSSGHGNPTSNGSCWVTSGTFRYDVHTINAGPRSPWTFSMCETSPAWDSRLLLYRSHFNPDRPCQNIVASVSRQAPCGDNDWITAWLDPGTYQLVVVHDAQQPLNDDSEQYTLTVSHVPGAGSLACDPQETAPPPNLLRAGQRKTRSVSILMLGTALCNYEHGASAYTDYVRLGSNPLKVVTVSQQHVTSSRDLNINVPCPKVPTTIVDGRKYIDVTGAHDIPGWEADDSLFACSLPCPIIDAKKSDIRMTLTAGSAPPRGNFRSTLRMGQSHSIWQWIDLLYDVK